MLSLGIETDEARAPLVEASPASIALVDAIHVINQPNVDVHIRDYRLQAASVETSD